MSSGISGQNGTEADPVLTCTEQSMGETENKDSKEMFEPRSWHNPQDHQSARSLVVEKIVMLLKQKFPNKTETSIRKIAQNFEDYSYHHCECFAQYNDVSTLKRRLFSYAVLKRKGPATCPSCGGATSSSTDGSIICAAGMSCIGSDQDPVELRQRQQNLLVKLRHASRCQLSGDICQVSCCPALRERWCHYSKCKDAHCTVPLCTSSRNVLNHYAMCKEVLCVLCGPVREVLRRAQSIEVGLQPGESSAGNNADGMQRNLLSQRSRCKSPIICRRVMTHLLPACAQVGNTGLKRGCGFIEQGTSKRTCFASNCSERSKIDGLQALIHLSRRAAMKGFVCGRPANDDYLSDEDATHSYGGDDNGESEDDHNNERY